MLTQTHRDRADIDAGTWALLDLFRGSGSMTRTDVARATGWARVTVNTRLDRLNEVGLLVEDGQTTAQRGRPAATFRFNPGQGLLLVADIGASGMRLARCDLAGVVQRRVTEDINIADGPQTVMKRVESHFDSLLDGVEQPVWGVGVSVPGPVERQTGAIVEPPIMSGWNGYRIADRLQLRYGAQVIVENDVNAMVVGEQRARFPDQTNLVFLKLGTGIGLGIVANNQVVRGAQGAAGDIGHTWADSDTRADRALLCRCGKLGCLEAYASGWAIVRDLTAGGQQVASVQEVVELVTFADTAATSLVRDAGRVIGAAVADVVSLLNPSVIVIGGQLAGAGEHLLGGIRELVYARSLPLATRDLEITTTALDGDAGLVGLAHGLADAVLSAGE